MLFFFFFQAEDGIRDPLVTGVQTCALPIFCLPPGPACASAQIWLIQTNEAAATAKKKIEGRFRLRIVAPWGSVHEVTRSATRVEPDFAPLCVSSWKILNFTSPIPCGIIYLAPLFGRGYFSKKESRLFLKSKARHWG